MNDLVVTDNVVALSKENIKQCAIFFWYTFTDTIDRIEMNPSFMPLHPYHKYFLQRQSILYKETYLYRKPHAAGFIIQIKKLLPERFHPRVTHRKFNLRKPVVKKYRVDTIMKSKFKKIKIKKYELYTAEFTPASISYLQQKHPEDEFAQFAVKILLELSKRDKGITLEEYCEKWAHDLLYSKQGETNEI